MLQLLLTFYCSGIVAWSLFFLSLFLLALTQITEPEELVFPARAAPWVDSSFWQESEE
jgi:hypothetical protein